MSSATADLDAIVPPDLMKAAMDLPVRARSQLATALFESLEETEEDPKIVAEAWKKEFARRIEEIRTGKVQLVDGRATLLRLRQELREKLAHESSVSPGS